MKEKNELKRLTDMDAEYRRELRKQVTLHIKEWLNSGRTREELAEAMNVTVNTIERWEWAHALNTDIFNISYWNMERMARLFQKERLYR